MFLGVKNRKTFVLSNTPDMEQGSATMKTYNGAIYKLYDDGRHEVFCDRHDFDINPGHFVESHDGYDLYAYYFGNSSDAYECYLDLLDLCGDRPCDNFAAA